MRRSVSTLAMVLLVTAFAAPAGEPPTSTLAPQGVLVLDPRWSMEPGVRTGLSAQALLFSYDEALGRLTAFDETSWGLKVLGVLGRAAKLELVDLPLASITNTFVHEVFGHGARAREVGLWPTYRFHLVSPYSALLGDTLPPGTFGGLTGRADQDLVMKAGGVEAQFATAGWIAFRAVQADGALHYGAALSYVTNKLIYNDRFFSSLDQGDTPQAGDPDVYVSLLWQRYGGEDPARQAGVVQALRWAYLWNYADPTFWASIYDLVVPYLFRGDRWFRLPMFTVGPVQLWPGSRFNLSPFGPEHYLEAIGRVGSTTVDVYGRWASGGLALDAGVGAHVFGIAVVKTLELGGELDLWYQSSVYAPGDGAPPSERSGINAGLFFDWRPWGRLGLTGKLAVKTAGYVMTEPLGARVYGYLGLSLTP